MNPLVTVIVPAFNAEKTIERCLCSIRNQSYPELEVLVVDDGSTDHTGQIVKRIAQTDERFHIFSKENSGVSKSRNLAIAQAKGEFLQFVDADDWLVKDATRSFVRAAADSGSDVEQILQDGFDSGTSADMFHSVGLVRRFSV